MFGKSKNNTRRIRLPFESTDEKPYIFVSYGHDDKEKVFPLLKTLYESGFNVWYDEGITIGEKYDEVIESHIRAAAVFLLFASPLSLSRPYVLDVELKIAEEIRETTPLLTLFLEKDIHIPEKVQALIRSTEHDRLEDVIASLNAKGVRNYGRRKAVPIEREVPQYWFDSYDPEPAGENDGGIVWCAEEPYACLAFHPDDLSACNPYAKELFFAGYNVRSCENLGVTDRERCLTSRSCRAYVPFVTKSYVESGLLKRDYLAAKKAGKPLIALYIRKSERDGGEERFLLPDEIAEEFSLLQGLDQRELTDNDFLSKLEGELERRKCFAAEEKGKVVRRSFEISDFLYDFTDGGKRLVLTKYRGEKATSGLSVKRAYFGFPVKEIGADAFKYNVGLKEIILSEGAERIGDGAFYSCDNLEAVSVPQSLKEIGEYSFGNCYRLKAFDLPSGIQRIPKRAFEDCDALTSFMIPDSVKEIGVGAFSQCTGLTSVSIPGSVVSIGDMAFYQCEALTSIAIPDSVTSLGDAVFEWCVSLTSVRLSRNIRGTGSESFTGCSALEHIDIPEGVTSVDAYAFYMADGLKSISIPESVTVIGEHAFEGCENLTSVTIPAGVDEIGDHAFEKCYNTECVTILSPDVEIGDGALDDVDLVRCHEDSTVWEYCEEACVDCEPL